MATPCPKSTTWRSRRSCRRAANSTRIGRRGRTNRSGTTRHAVGQKTDPHRELKRTFAQETVARLEAGLASKAFSRLVVVAPPVTLGDLRHAMSKALADHIAAEVAKDLVKVPNGEIRSHLRDVVAI